MALTVKEVEQALKQTDGNVSLAAEGLNVARSTIYRKIKRHPTLETILEDARESFVDLAQSKLRQEVQKGNITAIIFTLKTLGKSRGYVERQEVTGADGGRVEIKVVYGNDGIDS